MNSIEKANQIKAEFLNETVNITGVNYIVTELWLDRKNPIVIVEKWKTPSVEKRFDLEWFLNNFERVELY